MTRLIFHLNGGVLNLIVIHQVVLDPDPTRHRDRVAGSPAHATSSPASHAYHPYMYMVHIADFRDFRHIRRFSSAISSDTGAPSSNSFTLSFNSRHALRRTRSDTSIEGEWGPAGVQPVQIIINAAIIAPTETQQVPEHIRSAAARTLRFSLRCRDEVTRKKVYLPATQPRQLPSSCRPRPDAACGSVLSPPQTIKMVITTRAMAFTNAASVVSLSQPKVANGGRTT